MYITQHSNWGNEDSTANYLSSYQTNRAKISRINVLFSMLFFQLEFIVLLSLSHLADLLSPSLVRTVGVRNNVRSSYSQWEHDMTGLRVQIFTVARSVLFHRAILLSTVR